MKMFFEFFPIILFFVAFKLKGIYFATGVAIVAALVQVLYSYIKNKKVETMLLISLGVIVVFGGSTLVLHNEVFIKWKPTILYWIFSGVIFISAICNKNIIRLMLNKQIVLPETAWKNMNLSWGAFFAVLGAVNLFVAYNFSTNVWVNFKLFGILGLMLVFVIIQSLFLAKHIEK